MDSYEKLNTTQVDVKPLLCDAFILLLKSVKRRLTLRETIRNNRKVVVTVDLHRVVYLKFYKAVRDWSSEFGRSIHLNKKRNGEINTITISFHQKGSFCYHIGKIIEHSPKEYCIR